MIPGPPRLYCINVVPLVDFFDAPPETFQAPVSLALRGGRGRVAARGPGLAGGVTGVCDAHGGDVDESDDGEEGHCPFLLSPLIPGPHKSYSRVFDGMIRVCFRYQGQKGKRHMIVAIIIVALFVPNLFVG